MVAPSASCEECIPLKPEEVKWIVMGYSEYQRKQTVGNVDSEVGVVK